MKQRLPNILELGDQLQEPTLTDHRQAWFSPHRDHEATLKALSKAIGGAASLVYNATDEGVDGILAPAVARMLEGFRELLVGPCGRFDAGTLDRWALVTGAAIGYCGEHNTMAWNCCGVDALRAQFSIE